MAPMVALTLCVRLQAAESSSSAFLVVELDGGVVADLEDVEVVVLVVACRTASTLSTTSLNSSTRALVAAANSALPVSRKSKIH
eukprot:298127-Amphidinium_carterae.1